MKNSEKLKNVEEHLKALARRFHEFAKECHLESVQREERKQSRVGYFEGKSMAFWLASQWVKDAAELTEV